MPLPDTLEPPFKVKPEEAATVTLTEGQSGNLDIPLRTSDLDILPFGYGMLSPTPSQIFPSNTGPMYTNTQGLVLQTTFSYTFDRNQIVPQLQSTPSKPDVC